MGWIVADSAVRHHGRSLLQQHIQHPLRIRQKVPRDLKVFGPFVGDAPDAAAVTLVDPRVGIGHQDGRVRGDHEPAFRLHQTMQAREHRQLPLR